MNLTGVRRKFARKLRRKAHLTSRLLVRAFAEVPREHFLGPGPWQIVRVHRNPWRIRPSTFRSFYRSTRDSHPRRIYHDILVGIVPERLLNNGMPSGLAKWFDALALKRGDRVMHIGAGTGYYSAILAHVVGPTGRVVALEIDQDLAKRARANLSSRPNVELLNADGTVHDPGNLDAIFVNAGANRPCPLWLDRLKPGGRLIFPLVMLPQRSWVGPLGIMIRVTRRDNGYELAVVSRVGIFPCIGATDRDDDALVADAFKRGLKQKLRSLRRDPHEASPSCWLHGRDFCLSTDPLPSSS
jgi:protein-L-isoaspartate(D-aspartate) O-methyltransferase